MCVFWAGTPNYLLIAGAFRNNREHTNHQPMAEQKFAFIWPAPSQSGFAGDAFAFHVPVPTQPPGEWICPVTGCIGAQFKYFHGTEPTIQCNVCSGGFSYDHQKVHELILLNTPDVKYKYCPNPCCGHPTRQPKAAIDHPAMQKFSMGTYCRGCGAMWLRKDYIDEPKPKPWTAEGMTVVLQPLKKTGWDVVPEASAPPADDTEALKHVKPDPLHHGVIFDNIGHGRELPTLQNILRVLLSIENHLRRQEGVLQTVVGQRLARIDDSFDNISGAAEHMESLLEEIHEVVHNAVYDDENALCYTGAIRVYNENA